MPRDSQRSKLYNWELAELKTAWLILGSDNNPLGENGAREFTTDVWREFKSLGAMPIVHVMGNRGRGAAWRDEIRLSGRYHTTQTRWYVLHELAHVIQMRRPEHWRRANHGPEFCELYAQLLDRYTTANYDHVIASMREARLKVSR